MNDLNWLTLLAVRGKEIIDPEDVLDVLSQKS